jgi:hypothetical protein
MISLPVGSSTLPELTEDALTKHLKLQLDTHQSEEKISFPAALEPYFGEGWTFTMSRGHWWFYNGFGEQTVRFGDGNKVQLISISALLKYRNSFLYECVPASVATVDLPPGNPTLPKLTQIMIKRALSKARLEQEQGVGNALNLPLPYFREGWIVDYNYKPNDPSAFTMFHPSTTTKKKLIDGNSEKYVLNSHKSILKYRESMPYEHAL